MCGHVGGDAHVGSSHVGAADRHVGAADRHVGAAGNHVGGVCGQVGGDTHVGAADRHDGGAGNHVGGVDGDTHVGSSVGTRSNKSILSIPVVDKLGELVELSRGHTSRSVGGEGDLGSPGLSVEVDSVHG